MSDREGQSPTGLAFILYHSETDLTVGGDAAHALIDAAMRENRKRDLTGILYHERGVFLQWLEGPCDAVALVADRIERDTRHTGMVYLMRGAACRNAGSANGAWPIRRKGAIRSCNGSPIAATK